MNTQKHIYYITVGDVQTVAKETIGHRLREKEVKQVVEKLRDKIQWYDAIEEVILNDI
jgi:hypothetical protein